MEDAASTPGLYGALLAMRRFLDSPIGHEFQPSFKGGSYFLRRAEKMLSAKQISPRPELIGCPPYQATTWFRQFSGVNLVKATHDPSPDGSLAKPGPASNDSKWPAWLVWWIHHDAGRRFLAARSMTPPLCLIP